jgi:MYXO-CTERM domain-containing protein
MATAAGACTVAADQPGDGIYGPAPQVTQTVEVDQASQVLRFGALSGKAVTDAPFDLSAMGGGSTSAVTFTSLTAAVCTVTGSTVTLVSAGTCTIQADQTGDANYSAALPVKQSFTVSELAQSITFPELPSFGYRQGSATLAATASSGLPASYTVLEGPCDVSNGVLTASAAGTCVVAANQAGDARFAPAPQAVRSVDVTDDARRGCGCGATGADGSAQLLLALGAFAFWRSRRKAPRFP